MPDLPTAVAACDCLFCAGRGCDHCAGQKAFQAKRFAKRDRARVVSGKFAQPKTYRKPPSVDCCEKCFRIPGDLGVSKCLHCPPDPVGVRMCGRCGERPVRTSYGLCRKCYKSMPAADRSRFGHREKRSIPSWQNTIDPADIPEPTNFKPQTNEKIAVMGRRVGLRQETTHPEDALAKPVTAATYYQFWIEIALRYDAPRGIHWAPALRKWRARPWWDIKTRYHLGFYRNREDAIWAVRRWHELAAEMGPQKAMIKIRKERREA